MGTPNEWTLMFYYAGDNALSPVIVSQLKAIKDAGFQEDTDVVVYFDPSEQGVPTRIYDINRKRKRDRYLGRTRIGDGEDSFVHNLADDDVRPSEIDAPRGSASEKMVRALKNPDAISAFESLSNFLGYCRENHQAKNYILFLIGHGMIVANDAFLPDENPVSSITLKELDNILRRFADQVKKEDEHNFQLLALHSCSMSAIEVAYQLKGTANFMMASEGISYVNSWPQRQLLKKVFKTIKRAKEETGKPEVDVQMLMEKLYFLSLFNAKDFRLSGYPLDLALCSLDPAKFEGLKKDVQKLVVALKKNVGRNQRGNELILLAHWEAQSYWEERYTDLYDFCRCLRERCDKNNELQGLSKACLNVMKRLEPRRSNLESKEKRREERFKGIVIRADNFGSQYQYSHGLSVYFPWSRPIENANGVGKNNGRKAKKGEDKKATGILERYKTEYSFTTDLGDDSWFSFLDDYLNETQREKTREEEDGIDGRKKTFGGFDSSGAFPQSISTNGSLLISLQKPSPSSGIDCSCPSIKNYPEEKIPKMIRGKMKRNVKKESITEGARRPPEDLLEKSSAR